MSEGAAGRVTLPGKYMAVWQSINKQCSRLNGSLEASKRSSHTLGSGVQKSLADIGRTLDKIHGALETANDNLLQMQKRKPPTVTAVMKVDALQSQMAAQVQYMKSVASALGVTAQAAQVAKAEEEKARKVEWWKGFKEKAAPKKEAKKDDSKIKGSNQSAISGEIQSKEASTPGTDAKAKLTMLGSLASLQRLGTKAGNFLGSFKLLEGLDKRLMSGVLNAPLKNVGSGKGGSKLDLSRFLPSNLMKNSLSAPVKDTGGEKGGFFKGLSSFFKTVGSRSADFLKTANVAKPLNMVKSLGERAVKKAAKPEDIANWNTLNANVDASFGQIGEKALSALRPVLDTLNNAFASGRFDGFINGMANGFLVIATIVSELVNGILYIADAVQQNWDVVGPILAALAFVLLAAAITQIYTMAAAWLVMNWPILLIIGIIALLIYILSQCGVTAGEIAGFIGAAFGWMGALIQNILIGLYNNFLSFSDFLRNLFIDPIFAVRKLFYDLSMNVLNLIYQMALGIENFAGGFMQNIAKAINFGIRGINNLIEAISRIPGFGYLEGFKFDELDETSKVRFADMVATVRNQLEEPTSDKDVFNSAKKEMIDPTARMEEFKNKAINMTNKFSEKVSDISNYLPKADKKGTAAAAASGATNNGWMNSNSNANSNINHVNSVGSINKEVDISSDDLKMMRELAEIQAIQNFVELTPTVQVTTGNINNAGDIDSIITKIGQKLNEEFVSTAQGVYT